MLNRCLPAFSVVKKIHYVTTGSKDRCYTLSQVISPCYDVASFALLLMHVDGTY